MSPTAEQRRILSLAEAASQVRDADTLLFRRKGVISSAGRGAYSHAAKSGWWGSDLFCLEIREWHGGRAVTLESQVKRFPGCIDVYRPKMTPEECAKSLEAMRRKCGRAYNYAGILWASLLHLPVIRWFVSADTGDDLDKDDGLPEFCSQAVANADHIGSGQDPVPNLVDRLTEPSDLARSWFYQYLFTLVP